MNPFMLQMMMNPMGMGFMPFSCCSYMYSRPYERDLSFFNFPIVRDTSMDWILNPSLALSGGQQNWQYGGGYNFGGFGGYGGYTFPGFSPMINPLMNNRRTETEEEKKKRESKESEAKKPEAEKAASLKKVFDSVKNLAETNKGLSPIDKSIVEKAEEAMKKETAAEQLSAMKEVIGLIREDVLRKAILADDEVKKQLTEAGYNFNYSNNKYSLPVTAIVDNMNDVHDSIVNKLAATGNNTGLPLLVANVQGPNATTPILAAISTWNNTQKEKGIINFISNNIPTDNAAKDGMKECVRSLINALIDKADEYSGCDKIKKDRDSLAALKDTALKKFDSTTLKNLSAAFEKLYARLRMQEAVKVRNYIKSNTDYQALNEAKPGVISDGMIVDETYECLKKEGISSIPKENELDKIASQESVTVNETVVDINKKYENNPQGLIEEYLALEKGVLIQVDDTNVYQTKDIDGKGNGIKYYTVQGDKIVEVKKKSDGTFEPEADAKAVSADEILDYNNTATRIQELINRNAIEPVKMNGLKMPIFKAATKNEYYALIGNTFGKIKDCTGLAEDRTNKKIHATGTKKTLDKLTEADLEEFDPSDVKSKEQEANDKKEAEEKKQQEEIQNVTSATFASLKEAKSNKKLDEISKVITEKDGQYDFKALKINGYFYSNSTKRYYRYNENTNQLEYLKDVVEVNKNGYMKLKNGSIKECKEVISDTPIQDEELLATIQEYGKKFAKDVNGKSTDEEDSDAFRKLNTIIVKNDPIYTINFIKGYQEYGGFWSNKGICEQIAKEDGFAEGTSAHVFNSKRRYIREFAKLILKVVDMTNFDRESDDYATLQKIANGEYITKKYRGGDMCLGGFGGSKKTNIVSTAQTLDEIMEKVMKAYDEENS